jgi:carboxylesterase
MTTLSSAGSEEQRSADLSPVVSPARGEPARSEREAEEVGVLLVHGLNGGPFDMLELEEYLRARGLRVVNMLLPGHGDEDGSQVLSDVTWKDWVCAVQGELRALKRECGQVFLVGHSLGGALTLYVAAHEAISGVVAMCAPLSLHPWTLPLVRMARQVLPHLPWIWEDIHDPYVRRVYRQRRVKRSSQWRVLVAIDNLLDFLPHLRAAVPKITAPTLIMVSRHDHVVPPRDGREIYRRIAAQEKYLLTLHRSYHLITRDYDRQEVFARTADFIGDQVRKATKALPRESGEVVWTRAAQAPHESLPARLGTLCRRCGQQQWRSLSMRAVQATQAFTSWAGLVYTQTTRRLKQ